MEALFGWKLWATLNFLEKLSKTSFQVKTPESEHCVILEMSVENYQTHFCIFIYDFTII